MPLVLAPTLAVASEEIAEVATSPDWWLIALFTINGVVIWLFSQRRYLVWKQDKLRPAFTELQEFSYFLIAGTIIAQLWVHGDPASYHATVHTKLFHIGLLNQGVTIHFLVNEVFMTLFFGLAAKELAEATTKPSGPLRGMNGFLPLMACAGGVIGPAIVYRLNCTPDMTSAWAVPCATDIAFAWLGARIIWGRSHPAVTFLLAVAVADDFVGMGIIAICYPQRPFGWTGIPLLACGVAMAFGMSQLAHRRNIFRNWPLFLLPGAVCWLGLHTAGLHAALALVFVVPFIPMEGRDRGIFADDRPGMLSILSHSHLMQSISNELPEIDHHLLDPINRFDQAVRPLVDTGLFFFGLVNAGVIWFGTSAWDQNSWAVLLGLGVGKTLGITTMTIAGYPLIRLVARLRASPVRVEGQRFVRWRDIPLIGLLGAMGFTVALFVADAAGAHGSLKLGAMASFVYLGIAVVVGRWVVPRTDRVIDAPPPSDDDGPESSDSSPTPRSPL